MHIAPGATYDFTCVDNVDGVVNIDPILGTDYFGTYADTVTLCNQSGCTAPPVGATGCP